MLLAVRRVVSRRRARLAAQLLLHLRELLHLLLEVIGLLRELQELLLLDVVDLAQLRDLGRVALRRHRAVNAVAERADEEQRARRERRRAVFQHARGEADAVHGIAVLRHDLDGIVLLFLFLLHGLSRLLFQLLLRRLHGRQDLRLLAMILPLLISLFHEIPPAKAANTPRATPPSGTVA